jgi:hypothetical protein
MKTRSNSLVAFLVVGVVLAACAPAPTPAPVVDLATGIPAVSTVTPFEPLLETSPTAEQPEATAEVPTEVPQVAATSRGPNLESTAPSSVNLASGELQLVEFFRYT